MQGNALEKHINTIALFAGTRLSPSYNPTKQNPYRGRRKQYFDRSSDSFIWNNAKYASNFYAAQVQGCIPGDFDTVRGANIRTMDIVEQSTGTQLPNEWQCVFFEDPRIDGLYTGAKLWYGGNTWLCTAPKSVASDSGNAVIRRCNAIWNFLDYYGNVITEPFVWSKSNANATSNEYLDYNTIAHDYQRCCMQLNEKTRDIRHNQRVVLGKGVYQVSGIVDFICDFSDTTGDDGTVSQRQKSNESHIMYFDLYKTEPLAGVDDMENEVADALKFGWKIGISADASLQVGKTVNLGAYSLRTDAESEDVLVESTDEHPISYSYHSLDDSVLTVDSEGNITAVAAGSTYITVTLDQNDSIVGSFLFFVTEAATNWLTIAPELPDSLRMYESATAEVRYTVNGAETTEGITLTATGPDDYCYSATLKDGVININAYYPSDKPLVITITAGAYSLTKTIRLNGAV